jgi:hypothetical protein
MKTNKSAKTGALASPWYEPHEGCFRRVQKTGEVVKEPPKRWNKRSAKAFSRLVDYGDLNAPSGKLDPSELFDGN